MNVAKPEDVPQPSLEQKSMDYSAERKKSMRARYIYGVIFLIPNLCAWVVRDYGQVVLPQFHCKYTCISQTTSDNVVVCPESSFCEYLDGKRTYLVSADTIRLFTFLYCRSKVLWNRGKRLLSYARRPPCEFRMFCIFF